MKLKEYLEQERVTNSTVEVWDEIVNIPTYEIGEYEKSPIFLEKRVYQGSSGSVYPYAVVESVSDTKSDKPWRALFIENRFIKIMVLPDLGGRIHKAYDKVKKRDFIYYNQVIKPALVGLTGPWISGGIEFNWPQHHRPSTFLPTEYTTSENLDGSKTVWVNELEKMFGTKAMVGFTLYPDTAYIEIKANIYNHSTLPQTFLWWANPAVKVNDYYQSVFPPDVNAVFDHGKRDVSTFPIATGTYYKVDYSAGVDISRYKNIPVPTSYMAIKSKYDFVGGYENDTKGGLLHVASHHISPGKKQWTWGHGDFGRAWDRNLTDEDGPYIELMTGVYTDNQPDFSWLQPYEEKTFTQYFMPYHDLGVVSNATKDALIKIDPTEAINKIWLYVTSVYNSAKLEIKSKGITTQIETFDITPERALCFETKAELYESEFTLSDQNGKCLVSYKPEKPVNAEIPEPAKAAKDPSEIDSNEQLFLTGQHLEQYRHATYMPENYYKEALKRDSKDSRCNNAMGVLLLRKAQFSEAEQYLKKAVDTLLERNPNPYDSEPLYNLGITQRYMGKPTSAYDNLYKSCWSAAFQDAGYLSVSQIDTKEGRYNLALENVERSLIRNSHNNISRTLKASLLRHLGRNDEALLWCKDSLKIDRFNVGVKLETYLLTNDESIKNDIKSQLKNSSFSYMEYAFDYITAGLNDEAKELLALAINQSQSPIFHYMLAYIEGDNLKALEYIKIAESLSGDYYFPNSIMEVLVLQKAIELNPDGDKAPYYLGNFMYAKRVYDTAIMYWEMSVKNNSEFAIVHRNLALAYYNKCDDRKKALSSMEKAFALNNKDARLFMELDQLYKKLNYPHIERFESFEKHFNLVEKRDDLYIEYVTLLNLQGRYKEALSYISKRQFHPWEGGEGKITSQFLLCHISLAKEALKNGNAYEAIEILDNTIQYPHYLGEGKLPSAAENDIDYLRGTAYSMLGKESLSQKCFTDALKGNTTPHAAWYYNDASPDKIFYQARALESLGNSEEALKRYDSLIDFAAREIDKPVKIEYFAVSLPDLLIWEEDLQRRNTINCYYLAALGHLGKGETDLANEYFNKVLNLDINHQGAITHRSHEE